MINKRLLERKVHFIQKELAFLREYESLSLLDIVGDYKIHTIIERILERVINSAIDINQHIVAESEVIEAPVDYTETFVAMYKLKVFPKKFADVVSKSVGLRNALVHDYYRLDEDKFYQSIKMCLRDYTKYCDYILRFLKK